MAEYHEYKDVGHGFGLATDTNAEGWIGNAIQFWARLTHDNSPKIALQRASQRLNWDSTSQWKGFHSR